MPMGERERTMMSHRVSSALLIGAYIFGLTIFAGCGEGKEAPVIPDGNNAAVNTAGGTRSSRLLLGLWDIYFDGDSRSGRIEPLRSAQAHFNITPMLIPPQCNDCLKVVLPWEPGYDLLYADVTLRNPTKLIAHDVRGIVFTDEFGHQLSGCDGFTPLWDPVGGDSINPFIAYAKDEPNRAFLSGAQHTEQFIIGLLQPWKIAKIKFAVDAAWPGNCEEPYEITNFSQEIIAGQAGAEGNLYVDVLDWQGDVSKVTLNAPEIAGTEAMEFSPVTGNTWSLKLTNTLGADPGYYDGLIAAYSAGSGDLALYNHVTIGLSPTAVLNPVDVTPPDLNLHAVGVIRDGNYLYFGPAGWNAPAYFYSSFCIFDASDPVHPAWVSTVAASMLIRDMIISGGYAYCAEDDGLEIIDVDPPESAYHVAMVDINEAEGLSTVALLNGYAYVAPSYGEQVYVVDIDPPESAHVVKTLTTSKTHFLDADVEGNYVFFVGPLIIIDASVPEDAYIVIEDPDLGGACVDVVGDYAYLADQGYDGFKIVDVASPGTPTLVKTVNGAGQAVAIVVADGYAYVTHKFPNKDGMCVFDVDPIDSAFLATDINVYAGPCSIALNSGYAYLAASAWGLYIYDITAPESPHIVDMVVSPDADSVDASGSYAYLASFAGLKIADISDPGTFSFLEFVPDGFVSRGAAVSDGYAYLLGDYGMRIMNVQNPGAPVVVKTIWLDGDPGAIAFLDGYAYTGDYSPFGGQNLGFHIFDIDPPEDAYIVKTIPCKCEAQDIAISNGYAYVATFDGILVIDIDPIDSAFLVKTIIPGATSLEVSGGYAYILRGSVLSIMDIDPLGACHVVDSLEIGDATCDLDIFEGYACWSEPGRFMIASICPLKLIFEVQTQPDYRPIADIENGYAYLTSSYGGFEIIDLWQ